MEKQTVCNSYLAIFCFLWGLCNASPRIAIQKLGTRHQEANVQTFLKHEDGCQIRILTAVRFQQRDTSIFPTLLRCWRLCKPPHTTPPELQTEQL